MVIVKLWGGIGNQLFQYVLGQYVHYRFNQVVNYDDNTFACVDKLRKREIDAIADDIDYDNHNVFSKYAGIKGRMLRLIYQLNPNHVFLTDGSNIPEKYTKLEYYFQGYWQNYQYYDWLKRNVPQFRIKIKDLPKELCCYRDLILESNRSISLHIRRGDYFTPQNIKYYGVCDERYFHSAISKMSHIVPDGRYFVFTDDIEWVQRNIKMPEKSVIVQNYNISQFAYIELMSLCKHHIISNSSFSWWGAVLRGAPNEVVISPQKWNLVTDKTIALDNWIKI